MTVKELIELLAKHDPDLEVCISYDSGFGWAYPFEVATEVTNENREPELVIKAN
jgi:hypothetical protein